MLGVARACRFYGWLATALIIGATAACTSSTSSVHDRKDFPATYRATVAQYRAEFGTLQSQARSVLGKDLKSQLSLFDHMGEVTGTTLSQLHELSPPPAIKPSFDQLVAAMSTQESSLTEIVTAARKGDQVALNDALRAYADALQDGIALQQQVDKAVS
jgi:hypothetical protein